MLVLEGQLYMDFCDLLDEVACNIAVEPVPETLCCLSKELMIDPYKVLNDELPMDKSIIVQRRLMEFLGANHLEAGDEYGQINVFVPAENITILKNVLKKFRFEEDMQLAIEKSLEFFYPVYSYKIKNICEMLNNFFKYGSAFLLN